MSGIATLAMVNIDCPDPRAMAAFYQGLLGWEITHSQEEYAMVSDGTTSFGFGRTAGYQPPAWPDTSSSKQYHLDLYVNDLDKAVAKSIEMGGSKPEFQPGEGRWLVLLDPAGHPFCVIPKSDG